MIETIYIARHGFRMNWINNTWKSETGLPRDPPLAAFGVTQAQELAEYFLSLPENQRPTAIFSSPYYRCLQTANPVSAALGVPIYVEHGLSEWYSPIAEGTGLHPAPGLRRGEDVHEVHARAAGFLDALVPEVERRFPEAHARILLVSHAATTIALARALLGDRALPLRVGCASLTELVRKRDVIPILGGWDARRLADGAHLKDGASREWGFEDIEISNGVVVADPGVPGTEAELDEPVGCQVPLSSNL
ncbi:histidine phosphatase superfamily [Mycena vulgaris]|nr:histidine phosphatase superfamily [Mycena vulgaris]